MKAIISVSDKTNIVSFAKELLQLGYEILSTGGTLKALEQENIQATEVSAYTQCPEMFGGRIKTLHPKIHGGILYRRENLQDTQSAKEHAIDAIDLVCVNLYPFKATTQRTDDFTEILENIDIGGPAMLRAAAKNFAHVLVVTSPDDYALVLDALKNQQDTLELRRNLMIKAFEHTALYDATIANYMNQRFKDGFGDTCFISGQKVAMTRYGENPHQKGAIYEFGDFFSKHFKCLKGEASFNNYTDINQAIKIATNFGNAPAVAIIKHGNPCGFALKEHVLDSYKAALACDPISAYGGVLAVNGIIDEALAKEIHKHYIEVIVAGRISPEALEVFEDKKRIKLFCTADDFLTLASDAYDFKHIEGGFVFQESDRVLEQEITQAKQVSKNQATQEEWEDLKIAYRLAALVKSNCVVYVKNKAMVAVGMGMTSRVDAAKAAVQKAKEVHVSLQGAVVASEAYFPFRDSIDFAQESGIRAVIQPGGSIRDQEVIEAADSYGMALYFSGKRHFYH